MNNESASILFKDIAKKLNEGFYIRGWRRKRNHHELWIVANGVSLDQDVIVTDELLNDLIDIGDKGVDSYAEGLNEEIQEKLDAQTAQPDWTIAPEGTTHAYLSLHPDAFGYWEKHEDGLLYEWDPDADCWAHSETLDRLDYSPERIKREYPLEWIKSPKESIQNKQEEQPMIMKVVITNKNHLGNKVHWIKAWRELTRHSLKDAKDISEHLTGWSDDIPRIREAEVDLRNHSLISDDDYHNLVMSGLIIDTESKQAYAIRDAMKTAAILCIEADDLKKAVLILDMLVEEE